MRGVPGRFESVDEGQPFAVIVDYAHTPDSLENVLQAARSLGDGRLIVVFGAGGDRDREKRPLMGSIAAELADRAIVTTDNPRTEEPEAIAAEVAAGAPGSLEVIVDRGDAIEVALAEARPGDVVVIAGKGADTEMELAGYSMPFDDREVAREALAAGVGSFVIPLELSFLEPLGRLVARPWADAVTGMQIDSRRIEEGDLFVAVGGGADFVAHALARGAAAALVPDDPSQRSRRSRARSGRARRARVVGDHRLDRQDVDEGHPLRALRAAPAHDRERGELQQRDRRPAHALPDRGGHRALHRRDGRCAGSARSPGSRRSRGRTSA